MTAIVAGQGLGLINTSLGLLGGQGQLGVAEQGRSGEKVVVNAATGNLVVQQQDEWLVGVGPDLVALRTYNSRGAGDDDNADNWRLGLSRKITGTNGASTVTRTAEDGSVQTFTLDYDGKSYTGREGGGSADKLRWDSGQSAWIWTDGDTLVTETYLLQSTGVYQLREIKDIDGHSVKLTYDSVDNRLVKYIDTAGAYTERVEVVYDTVTGRKSNILSLTTTLQGGALVKRVSYRYDTDNRLDRVKVDLTPTNFGDAQEYVTEYSYFSGTKRLKTLKQGTLSGGALQVASALEFDYNLTDGTARIAWIKETVGADVRQTSFSYFSSTGGATPDTTRVTDPQGQITDLTYDISGVANRDRQLKSVKMPAVNGVSATTSYAYDDSGNVTSITDARGAAITYRYDAGGNRIYERDAQGNVVERAYSSTNRLLTETVYTSRDTDGFNTGAKASGGLTTRYIYDNQGRLRYVVGPQGQVTEHRYNALGQRESVLQYTQGAYSDAALAAWSQDFSANTSGLTIGNAAYASRVVNLGEGTLQVLSKKLASGSPDVYAPVYGEDKPLGTSWSAEIKLPADFGSQHASLLHIGLETGTTAGGATTFRRNFLYISSGHLYLATAAANGTPVYNSRQLTPSGVQLAGKTLVLEIETQPDGHSQLYVYEKNQERASGWSGQMKLDSGTGVAKLTIYGFGSVNTVDAAVQIDNLKTQLRPSVANLDTWKAGNVTVDGASTPILSRVQRTDYTYDTRGQLETQKTYGKVDDAGVGDATTQNVTQYVYDQAGNLLKKIDPRGQEVLTRDTQWAREQRKALGFVETDGSGRLVANLSQADKNTIAAKASFTTAYTYDGLNRITSATEAQLDGTQRTITTVTSYDDSLRKTTVNKTATLSGATVTLEDDATVVSTYDEGGRLLSVSRTANTGGAALGTTSYTYDRLGRLVMVQAPTTASTSSGGERTYYLYDAANRRVGQIDAEGALTEYRYNADNQVVRTIGYAEKVSQAMLDRLASGLLGENLSQSLPVNMFNTDPRITADGKNWTLTPEAGGNVSAGSTRVNTTPPGMTTLAGDTVMWVKQNGTEAIASTLSSSKINVVTGQMYEVSAYMAATGAMGSLRVRFYNGSTQVGADVTPSGTGTSTNVVGAPGGASLEDYARVWGYVTVPAGATSMAVVAIKSATSTGSSSMMQLTHVQITPASTMNAQPLPVSVAPALSMDSDGRGLADRNTWSIYDDAGRLVRTLTSVEQSFADGMNGEYALVSEYVYDGAGRLTDTLEGSRVVTSSSSLQRLRTTPNELRLVNGAITIDSGTGSSFTLSSAAFDVHRTRNFYNDTGLLIGTLDAENYYTAHTYDSAGQLTQSTRYAKKIAGTVPEGNTPPVPETTTALGAIGQDQTTRYFYDAQGRLTGVADPELYYTAYEYDGAGNRTKETRYVTKVGPTGTPTPSSNPASDRTVVYGYDGNNRLVRSEDKLTGLVTEQTYDARGNLSRSTTTIKTPGQADAQRTQQRRYDALGRVTAELGGVGSAKLAALPGGASPAQKEAIWNEYATWHTYDQAGRRTSTTEPQGLDASGLRTVYYYDGTGRLTHSINALGEVEQFTYNAFGEKAEERGYAKRLPQMSPGVANLSTLTGGNKKAIASLLQTSGGEDSLSTYGYTRTGQLKRETHYSNWLVSDTTRYAYDLFGRIEEKMAQVYTGGSTQTLRTIYGHDRRGLQVTTALTTDGYDPLSDTLVERDAFGRIFKETDANGNTREHRFDRLGREVTTYNAGSLSNAVRTAYDAFNRAWQIKGQYGTVIQQSSYNLQSGLITTFDGEFALTIRTVNSLGELVSIKDGRGNVTSYTYNEDGQLTSTTVTDGDTSEVLRSETTAYDKAGRLTGTFDALTGKGEVLTYDAASRVVSRKVTADGKEYTVNTRHDALGRAVWTQDANGTWTKAVFDMEGRVVGTIIDPVSIPDIATASTDTTSLVPNSSGLNLDTQYLYDAQGRQLAVIEAYGTAAQRVTQYLYDARGRRIEEIVDPTLEGVTGLDLKTTYVYDDNDNVIARKDPAGGITRYVYDASDKLSWLIDAAGAVTHTEYDAVGNASRVTAFAKTVDLGALALGAAKADVMLMLTNQLGSLTPNAAVDHITYNVYDTRGRSFFTVDAEGYGTERAFDETGNVVLTTRYAYKVPMSVVSDGDDRVSVVIDASALAALGAPSAPGTPAPSEANRVDQYVYDGLNRVIGHVDAEGGYTRTEYSSDNRQITRTRYLKAVVYPSAWTLKQLSTNQLPDVVGSEPDAASITKPAVWAQDGKDVTTYTMLDALGRVIAQIDGENYITINDYDALGNLVKRSDGSGRSERYVYDRANRRTHVADAQGTITKSDYDEAGHVKGTSVYADALPVDKGVMVSQGGMLVRSLGTFAAGDKVTITLNTWVDMYSLGKISVGNASGGGAIGTRLIWGDRGTQDGWQPVTVTFNVTAPGPLWLTLRGDQGTLGRDVGYDNIVAKKLLAAGGETALWSDSFTVTDPSTPLNDYAVTGKVERGQYLRYDEEWVPDAAIRALSNLLTSSQTSTFKYDTAGRLIEETHGSATAGASDQSTTRYKLDGAGRREQIVDPRGLEAAKGTSQWAINERVRILGGTVASRTSPLADENSADFKAVLAAYTTKQAFDGMGRVKQTTNALGGVTKTDFDAFGNAVRIQDPNESYGHFVFNRLNQATWQIDPMGYATETKFNAFGEVDEIVKYSGDVKNLASIWNAATKTTGAPVTDGSSTSSAYLAPNAAKDAKTTIVHDKLGHQTKITDAEGYFESMGYDLLGNKISYTAKSKSNNKVTLIADGNVLIEGSSVTKNGGTNGVYDAAFHSDVGFAGGAQVSFKADQANKAFMVGLTTIPTENNHYSTIQYALYCGSNGSLLAWYGNQLHDLGTIYKAKEDTLSVVYDGQAVRFLKNGITLGNPVAAAISGRLFADGSLSDSQAKITDLQFNDAVATHQYTYDRRGLLIEEKLPEQVTRLDLVTGEQIPGNPKVDVVNQYQYDGNGNKTQAKEAAGLFEERVTTYRYDAKNREISRNGEAQNIIDMSSGSAVAMSNVAPIETRKYDARGNLVEVRALGGAWAVYYYDALDRKVGELNAVESDAGAFIKYEYDKSGNIVKRTAYATQVWVSGGLPVGSMPNVTSNAALDRVIQYTYDVTNRLQAITVKDVLTGSLNETTGNYELKTADMVTSYAYDQAGNPVISRDGRGIETYNYYDAAGNKVASIDGEKYIHVWEYDHAGNVITESVASNKWAGTSMPTKAEGLQLPKDVLVLDRYGAARTKSYVWDRVGHITSQTWKNVLTGDYADSPTIINATSRDLSTSFKYNGLGQIVEKVEATGDKLLWAYDKQGREIRKQGAEYTDATSVLVRQTEDTEYNGLGLRSRRIEQDRVWETIDAQDRITTYQYDQNGRLAKEIDALGNAVNYMYDQAGRMTQRTIRREDPDGAVHNDKEIYEYHASGKQARKLMLADGDGAVPQDYLYTNYNMFGEFEYSTSLGGSVKFAKYDKAGRLITSNSTGAPMVYIRDLAGNVTLAISPPADERVDLYAGVYGSPLYNFFQFTSNYTEASIRDAINAGAHANVAVFDKRNLQTDTYDLTSPVIMAGEVGIQEAMGTTAAWADADVVTVPQITRIQIDTDVYVEYWARMVPWTSYREGTFGGRDDYLDYIVWDASYKVIGPVTPGVTYEISLKVEDGFYAEHGSGHMEGFTKTDTFDPAVTNTKTLNHIQYGRVEQDYGGVTGANFRLTISKVIASTAPGVPASKVEVSRWDQYVTGFNVRDNILYQYGDSKPAQVFNGRTITISNVPSGTSRLLLQYQVGEGGAWKEKQINSINGGVAAIPVDSLDLAALLSPPVQFGQVPYRVTMISGDDRPLESKTGMFTATYDSAGGFFTILRSNFDSSYSWLAGEFFWGAPKTAGGAPTINFIHPAPLQVGDNTTQKGTRAKIKYRLAGQKEWQIVTATVPYANAADWFQFTLAEVGVNVQGGKYQLMVEVLGDTGNTPLYTATTTFEYNASTVGSFFLYQPRNPRSSATALNFNNLPATAATATVDYKVYLPTGVETGTAQLTKYTDGQFYWEAIDIAPYTPSSGTPYTRYAVDYTIRAYDLGGNIIVNSQEGREYIGDEVVDPGYFDNFDAQIKNLPTQSSPYYITTEAKLKVTVQPSLVSDYNWNASGEIKSINFYYRPLGSTQGYTKKVVSGTVGASGFVESFLVDMSTELGANAQAEFDVYYEYMKAGSQVLTGMRAPFISTPIRLKVVRQASTTMADAGSGLQMQGIIAHLTSNHNKVVYNAFGEVVQEFDARATERIRKAEADLGRALTAEERNKHATTLSYNNLGLLVEKKTAQTMATLANGFQTPTRAATTYVYDGQGRLIAERDALGSQVSYKLRNAGEGQRIVATESRMDQGKTLYAFDEFGDTVKKTVLNDVNAVTDYQYDKMHRLVRATRPVGAGGKRATDLYVYDSLGHQIKHQTSPDVGANASGQFVNGRIYTDTTKFDAMGRVIELWSGQGSGVDPETSLAYQETGLKKTMSYEWAPNGQLTQNTVDENGKANSSTVDTFGRQTFKVDQGGRSIRMVYNLAGNLVQQYETFSTGNYGLKSGGQNITYRYYVNGQLKSLVDDGIGAIGDFEYDRNGNLTYEGYTIKGALSPHQRTTIVYDELNRISSIFDHHYNLVYEYDAVGNRRYVKAGDLDDGSSQEYWYDYDNMNRMAVSMGVIVGGRATSATTENRISQGTTGKGVRLTYDKASQRKTAVYAAGAFDTYSYTADGYLTQASTDDVTDSVAARVNDLLGRVKTYTFTTSAGVSSQVYIYLADGRVKKKTDITADNHTVITTNSYVRQSDSKEVALLQSSLVDQLADSEGKNALKRTYKYDYTYFDSALQSSIRVKGESPDVTETWAQGVSRMYYDVNGHIKSAIDSKDGGDASTRTITYVNNSHGQVLTREEHGSFGTPLFHSYYYVNGRRVGEHGNLPSTTTLNFADAMAMEKTETKGRYKKVMPIISDFDQNYQPINESYPFLTASTHVVSPGENLESIALSTWGDATLWYLIADANNIINKNAALTVGQSLIIPNKVTNLHNTSQTFKVYNPGETLGDISPTLPEPPPPPPAKAGGRCGALGIVLQVVVQVAVTIFVTVVTGGNVVAGAVAGNLAGQLVAIADDRQSRIHGKSVVDSAKSAALMYLLFGPPPGVNETTAAVEAANTTRAAVEGAQTAVEATSAVAAATQWVATAAANAANYVAMNTIAIGVGNLAGLNKFSWKEVLAASAGDMLGAGVRGVGLGNAAGQGARVLGTAWASSALTKQKQDWVAVAASAVGSGIGEAIRPAVERFGSALGDAVVGSIQRADAQKPTVIAEDEARQRYLEESVAGPGGGTGKIDDRMKRLQELTDRIGAAQDKLELQESRAAAGAAADNKYVSINIGDGAAPLTADQSAALALGAGPRTAESASQVVRADAFGRLLEGAFSGGGTDSGISVGDLAGRFGQGVLGAVKSVTVEPVLQVRDMGAALASVTYNELLRGDGDAMWFPEMKSGMAQASANGASQGRLLLQSTPVLGIGVASYDLTTAVMNRDWGAAAESSGGLLGGFAIGAGVNKFGGYGIAFDDVSGPMQSQMGAINPRFVKPIKVDGMPDLATNPKHIPGGDGYNRNAGTQPADYATAYEKAITANGGKSWFAASTDGAAIYRYADTGDGTVHWNGSTADASAPLTRAQVPPEVAKQLGFKTKGGKWK